LCIKLCVNNVCVIQDAGAIPAFSASDDRSHAADQSVSDAVVAGGTIGSCCCNDQTNVVAGGLGVEQIEQMINDKLTPLLAKSTDSVDGKLATLHSDLRSWTQQLVMAELANKQQVTDAQQLADRSSDIDKFAELVRNLHFSSFLFLVMEL